MALPIATIGDKERLLAGFFFRLRKYDKDGSTRVVYAGRNQKQDASDDTLDWVLSKYTFDAQGVITNEEIAIGSWTLRNTYF